MRTEKLIGRLTLRLPDSLLEALDQEAERRGTSTPDLMRQAANEFLSRQRDADRLAATEQRLLTAIQAAVQQTARLVIKNLEVEP